MIVTTVRVDGGPLLERVFTVSTFSVRFRAIIIGYAAITA